MNIRPIEDDSLMKLGMVFITILGGNPNIGGGTPPKWMVDFMEKPYFLMDVLGGKPTIFGNSQIWGICYGCSTLVMLESLSCDVCSDYWFQNEESSHTYLHYLKLTLRPWKMGVARRSYSFLGFGLFYFQGTCILTLTIIYTTTLWGKPVDATWGAFLET